MTARDLQRQIRRGLDERRTGEADIKFRRYVRPQGREFAVVKASENGLEFVVSAPAGKTYSPGAVVPTGSYTGEQGEFIITDPPPGRRGVARAVVTGAAPQAAEPVIYGTPDLGNPVGPCAGSWTLADSSLVGNSGSAATAICGVNFDQRDLWEVLPSQDYGSGPPTVSNVVVTWESLGRVLITFDWTTPQLEVATLRMTPFNTRYAQILLEDYWEAPI